MSATTGYQHIVLSESGVPLIAGTSIKVIELVLDHKAYGWSPEELHLQHPHLSLGQIHSALAYYWDHQAEIEQEIEQGLQRVQGFQKTLKQSTLRVQAKA
jgi:uncharacterized protein (DUF433 family)